MKKRELADALGDFAFMYARAALYVTIELKDTRYSHSDVSSGLYISGLVRDVIDGGKDKEELIDQYMDKKEAVEVFRDTEEIFIYFTDKAAKFFMYGHTELANAIIALRDAKEYVCSLFDNQLK